VTGQPAGDGQFGQAALLLLFAYAGFENKSAPPGEYCNPQRDVSFALLVQVTVVTTIYFGVQLVALGTFPGVAHSSARRADAAAGFLGS